MHTLNMVMKNLFLIKQKNCPRIGWIHFIVLFLFSNSIWAQTTTNNTATANYTVAQPAASTTTSPLAVNDEPYALYDGLVKELWKGGYVIYMRHGAVQPGLVEARSAGEWWKDCAKTIKLGVSALPNAQAIGQAIRRQNIQIDEVQTSEFCRAYDTAVFLGIAQPKRIPALNALTAFESQKKTIADLAGGIAGLLSAAPPPGKNRLLVGHSLPPTIVHPVLSILQEGHTAIFRPDGNGAFHLVATLSPGQWQWISKQTIFSQAQTQVQAQVVPQPPPPQPPLIDPAKELKGVALVQALRKGGYTLYMRHASSTIGQDTDLLKVPMWWENCMIQRNISDVGREQSKKVGAAIRELKLPIGWVKASQFCRARDTANLMELGNVDVTEDLNHAIGQRPNFDVNVARFNQVATPPARGKNILLVSHTHGSARNEERIMGGMQEAEIVVYLPDGKGGAEPLARIPPTEWDNLIMLMKNTKG